MNIAPRTAPHPVRAFTLIEVLISTAIMAMAIGAVMAFTEGASRSLANISNQSQITTATANLSQLIAQRIRLAVFASTDTNGNTLFLAFDDNINLDSDADGNKYNDRNHYESFQFNNTDGSDATTKDNQVLYRANTNLTNVVIVLSGGVRKLPGTNVFSLSQTGRVVHVNLGVLDRADGRSSQTIEIRTSFVRRNR